MHDRPWAIAITLSLVSIASCAQPPGGRARPNVVLIVIDSLRADHLGSYGYGPPTSPVIDSLAARGVRFENAVSSTSWTLPSHAALFTGMQDSAHGVLTADDRLAEGHLTLAEILRDAGYETAGFFGGPFLHPAFGLGQGHETWQSCMTGLADDASEQTLMAEAVGNGARTNAAGHPTGPRTLNEVRRWLDGREGERPFYLFVHLWDVHHDYAPPPELVELFDPDYAGSLDASGYPSNPGIHAGMDPRDLRHLLALYDGEIRFTDGIVGELLEGLEERGLLEEALVVLTSDHGEEFFEHGGKGHQHELHDELIRVPLILVWPGRIEPGRIVRDQVSLVDVMPTILGLTGVEDPGPRSGRDLSPLLHGGSLAARPALSELDPGNTGVGVTTLRTSTLKVVSKRGVGRYGFDLAEDSGETRPIPPQREDVQAALRELRAHLQAARELRASLALESPAAAPDEALRRELRDLGYLDG